MFFYAVLTTTKMKTLTTSAVNRCVAAILFQKIGVWRTGNTRKYRQSDVYIDQCVICSVKLNGLSNLVEGIIRNICVELF